MSTATVSTGLTGPQLQALGALLAGGSTAEAAEAGRVSPRTVRDWLQQSEFRAEFLHGQQQLFHQISMQLAGAAARALRTLIEISEDPEQKGSVRVAAANKVMHLFLHHGPRVSALLAPPETPETLTEDVVTKARAYDSIMESLERIYGSDDKDAPSPGDASLPTPAAAPASTLASPPPAAPGSVGLPETPPASEPHGAPPARVLPPSASASRPARCLTLPRRSAAETPAPHPKPFLTFVPRRD